ncbi:hypothetical protein H6504_00540 [Candidatus Woesearchaeota archaeon]|nr:hypothetical protein [Candidatus Woesearchaeota archaeon]
MVIKRNGTREPFSGEKLGRSIKRLLEDYGLPDDGVSAEIIELVSQEKTAYMTTDDVVDMASTVLRKRQLLHALYEYKRKHRNPAKAGAVREISRTLFVAFSIIVISAFAVMAKPSVEGVVVIGTTILIIMTVAYLRTNMDEVPVDY